MADFLKGDFRRNKALRKAKMAKKTTVEVKDDEGDNINESKNDYKIFCDGNKAKMKFDVVSLLRK